MWPRARKHDLVIQPVAHDVIVYDRARNRAHRLNRTTALVWQHCDGGTSPSEIAALLAAELRLPFDERIVWMAWRQLDEADLLTRHVQLPPNIAPLSRRQAIALGVTGVVALLLPACESITTPSFTDSNILAASSLQQRRCKEGGCKGEIVAGKCVCTPTEGGCGKREGESDDCKCFAVEGRIGRCNCICAGPDDVCDPVITVVGVIAGLAEVKQGSTTNYQVRGFAGNCGTCQHRRCERKTSCEWKVSDPQLATVNPLPNCNAQLGAQRPGNVTLTATFTLSCTGSNLACAAATSQAVIKAININV
jgi:hypothetical protein